MKRRAWGVAAMAWLVACGGGEPDEAETPPEAAEEVRPDFIQEAVWSADGERLAVSWNRGTGFRLYGLFAGTDSTPPEPSTGIPLSDGEGMWASWSPDGLWVAYQAGGDVWRMRPDGMQPERLTDGPSHDGEPAYSPDGRTIAFVSDRDGEGRRLYLMDADGDNVRPIDTGVAGDHFGPAWSPDGRRLVFYATTEEGDVVYLTAPAGGSGRVTTGVFPAWSPDGTDVYFDRNDTIFVKAADGGGTRFVLADGFAPRPSPDGMRLAFVRGSWPTSSLWLKNLESEAETRITPQPPGR